MNVDLLLGFSWEGQCITYILLVTLGELARKKLYTVYVIRDEIRFQHLLIEAKASRSWHSR